MSNRKLVAGILAHVDAGKTTLSEALLYEMGVIKQLGRVDSKTSYLDTDTVERERGITIYTKNARIPFGDDEMILIDTPGHVDFSTEMERALSVLDVAILLISAPSGIQPHTKTLWSLLKAYRIPTIIFVNKMDMEGADKEHLLDELKKMLSGNIADFSSSDINEIYENVATTDEELLDKYLNEGELSASDVSGAILSRKIFPVYFGSALRQSGVKELVSGLKTYLFDNIISSDEQSFSARVYKISRDAQHKRLTTLKILSGTLKVKQMLGAEKVNEIRIYSGDKFSLVTEVGAGDICTISGLNDSNTGMIYGETDSTQPPVLSPALSYAIRYPDSTDQNKMLEYLRELEDEDPSLNVEYREQTREIFVALMGEIQTEVLKRQIKDRFNVDVEFTDGRICYRETVDGTAIGVGHFEPLRHYAEAHIKIEPGEPGCGMTYSSEVSEDLLARNWQRLILTHMAERDHRGVLLGAPVTDLKLTLVAGRAHQKHTEGGDFRQATYRAIRQGLMKLRTEGHIRILEPYYNYTLEIPENYVGRAMTDITQMNGSATITDTDLQTHTTTLTGHAPVSTMKGYMRDVIAYTKGLGHLSLAMAGYDLCHNEEEIYALSRYNPETDLKNPCDSVFCAHGSGFVVPWSEVDNYKHLEYSEESGMSLIIDDSEAEALNLERQKAEKSSSDARFLSVEEVDSILRNSTHSNVNKKKDEQKGLSKAWDERRREEAREFERQRAEKIEAAAAQYKKTEPAVKPKERYILVDGYNVLRAWKELDELASHSFSGATGRLNDIMCSYQAIIGVPMIVVYDAYKVAGHPVEKIPYHNITLVYTKTAQTADQYIERYAQENAKKYDITVVTSDGLEQVIVTGAGCNLISSREFELIVNNTIKDYNERYGVT